MKSNVLPRSASLVNKKWTYAQLAAQYIGWWVSAPVAIFTHLG